MERNEFNQKRRQIENPMSEQELKARIHEHSGGIADLPCCIGELSELILELTRHQRGKMNRDDFLQELSHVQWAVWSLQDIFDVSDTELRAAVQASFR